MQAIAQSVEKGRKVLSSEYFAEYFNHQYGEILSTPLPTDIEKLLENSANDLISFAESRTKKRITIISKQNVADIDANVELLNQEIDELSGLIFFAPAPEYVDLVKAATSMYNVFKHFVDSLQSSQDDDREKVEVLQDSLLRVFTFTLALLGISDDITSSSSLNEFLVEYAEAGGDDVTRIFRLNHKRIEAWLSKMEYIPSVLVRKGNNLIQYTKRKFAELCVGQPEIEHESLESTVKAPIVDLGLDKDAENDWCDLTMRVSHGRACDKTKKRRSVKHGQFDGSGSIGYILNVRHLVPEEGFEWGPSNDRYNLACNRVTGL